MAKKTAQTSQKNSFDFSNISGLIDTMSKKEIISIEDFEKEKSFISTGVYILDALLSKSILHGGISNNRITLLAGPKQTGKSFLSLNIARNAQKLGYNIIWIDTEFSIEKSDFDMYGIDTSDSNKFMLIRTNIVEKIKMFMTSMLDDMTKLKEKGMDVSKTIFFLDSIGMLSSEKEKADTLKLDIKQDMTRAKQIKSLVRLITNDLGFLGIPLVATNHIYLCLTGGHKVLKSDGTSELIENIVVGDSIKTLEGNKTITKTVEYTKCPIIQITLETGEKIKCTPQHRFLVKSNWVSDENNDCWKKAEELTNNDIILSIDK
jgi:archaellum biogenesis ATPase FlaH